jgi:glycerol-1-phosphate dehydrogenase [NAD(P)+]
LAKETTPLSGYEHVLSHALDFLRLTSGRPLVLHGEQVALGCLASAHAFEWLLEIPKIEANMFRKWPLKQCQNAIKTLLRSAPYFGFEEATLAKEDREKRLETFQAEIENASILFTAEFEKKHAAFKAAEQGRQHLLEHWNEVRQELRRLTLPSLEMLRLLEQAKLPVCPEETSPPTSALEFRFAARFSPFVRARWSVADLIFWLDFDPAVASAV